MRNAILILLLFVIAGCSRESDALRRELAEKDAMIQALQQELKSSKQQARQDMEKKLWDAEMRHNQELEAVQEQLENNELEFEQTIQFTRAQLADREARIDALEMLKNTPKPEARSSIEKPPEPRSPVQIHIVPPPTAAGMPIVERTAQREEPMVRIYDVRGEKVITGSHVSHELIETDETYRDDFGKKARVVDWKEKTVSQYGHQVVFSASNMTTSAKTITARAGRAQQQFTIQPGEVMTNLSVEAEMGVGLRVGLGLREESYEVLYE